MKKFPLCFWNYATFEQMGEHPVKDWVDAGFTMALSPVFRKGTDDPAQMVKLLDECLANDISVIIDDARCKWNGVIENEKEYRKNFCEMLAEFGSHKAVYGFYVGDEPAAAQMESAIKAVQVQKELCPDKEPFINFNPYYDGNEASLGGMCFEDWAHGFAKDSGIRQFSYDCYGQMNPDDEAHNGLNYYFLNLKKFTAAAKRENLPLWVTNLAVPHFRYRTPTEDDFRWQLNTTVASGANGAWWFYLYLRLPRINYRLAPIDEYGNRTESYERLARVQRIFSHQFGALFANLIHDETYHTVNSYGTYPLFQYNTHKYLKKAAAVYGTAGIVSFFHTKKNEIYCAVVNNSQTESDLFQLTFTEKVESVYRVVYGLPASKTVPSAKDVKYPVIQTEYGSFETNCLKNDNANNCRINDGQISNDAWLAPGQMEVYRLVIKE